MVRKFMARLVLVLALSVAVARVAGAQGGFEGDEDDGHAAIVWVGAVATNVFYIPAKIIYAGIGGLTGSLAWAVTGGDSEVAGGVWQPSMRGTYLITPSMLEGKEDVHFIGS